MISLPYNIVTNLLLEVMKPGKDCSLHLLIISPHYNTLNILINSLQGAIKLGEDCSPHCWWFHCPAIPWTSCQICFSGSRNQGTRVISLITLQMLTSAFVWVVLIGLTFAPFPPEHQYNFLNPVIDPWWAVTKKEIQWNKSMDISLKSIGTNC